MPPNTDSQQCNYVPVPPKRISALGVVVTRVESAWKAAATNNDELYYDSVALNIHSFYSGLERVFEKISSAVDSSLPQGINWHQELLNQMTLEIPNVRPAVIQWFFKEAKVQASLRVEMHYFIPKPLKKQA